VGCRLRISELARPFRCIVSVLRKRRAARATYEPDQVDYDSHWSEFLLDLSILVPMTKMNWGEYCSEIGIRYLLIPIMAGAMGTVGSQQRQEC
jgi:hypothetical protein